jgi:hypothetical protein
LEKNKLICPFVHQSPKGEVIKDGIDVTGGTRAKCISSLTWPASFKNNRTGAESCLLFCPVLTEYKRHECFILGIFSQIHKLPPHPRPALHHPTDIATSSNSSPTLRSLTTAFENRPIASYTFIQSHVD